jgi:glycerol-3-phosphate dehydrogenase
VRALSPTDRLTALDRLDVRPYDLLVVGGGITGAGIALDAAARGLRVALVERDDLASGTSSRSSSLVHGGLRYLSTGMMSIVRESAVERERLRRIAPHLVRPIEFVITAPRRFGPALGATLWAYDAMASFRTTRPRRVARDALAALLPAMSARSAGWTFTDCRTDDARLVLEVARTAARLGADIVSRAEVVELLRAGGRVVGATVCDRLGGRELDVRARWVVSATGVWADVVRGLAGQTEPLLLPSKGTHLVFSHDQLPVRDAVIVPSRSGDHRSAFLIPGHGHVVVGTTDTVYDGSLDTPGVEDVDAAYLCDAVNRALGTNLGPGDAVGAWAGLRPLVHPGGRLEGDSEALSRRHVVLDEPEGLVTITGGKLTTYRRMAEELVDRLVPSLGRGGPSRTSRLRLGLRGGVDAVVRAAQEACEQADIDPQLAAGLVERHGDAAVDVVARATETGETGLLVPGLDYLEVEARWAVEQELALSVEDVLDRRLRVARRHRAAGGAAVRRVAGLLQQSLGWADDETEASATAYLERVAAERGPVPLHRGVSTSSV